MININDTDPNDLLDKMLTLRNEVYEEGMEYYNGWEPSIGNHDFKNSALNLSHYLALRRRDIRDIQEELSPWGLSSLERLESGTMDTIDAVISSLGKITGRNVEPICYPPKSNFTTGREQLMKNAESLFGKCPDTRNTRIMVTMPSESCKNYRMVFELMDRGMDVARINSAHDDPDVWEGIIKNIRRAEECLGKTCKVFMDIAGPKSRISWIFSGKNKSKVGVGDEFILTGRKNVSTEREVNLVIGCSSPEMFEHLLIGDRVFIDDGIVEGKVEDVLDEGLLVRVNKVQAPKGIRLKVDKGINFPDADIKKDVVTDKDRQDLDFICNNADIIGISFVKSAEDIEFFLSEIRNRVPLEKINGIPLIAKIETIHGVNNLPEIIMETAGRRPFGVMIARGDLAVESGYLRLAELQQEILRICEASDIPVIWATQVLDNMVTTGIPTRAEVTDVAEGGAHSECVMLNKGNCLIDTMCFLDKALERLERPFLGPVIDTEFFFKCCL